MSEEEREAAFNLLRSPNLLEQIEQDLSTCGLVGEANNKLITYLAATSRKSDRPLAVMVQSSSAAGKSSLMESVLNFIPDEDKIQYSAMTGQSLFYLGEVQLKHKVLAIAEEEGAEQASYALKLLQSEGRLRIASTGKASASGRHTTHTYEVEGPVAILSTTTAFDVDKNFSTAALCCASTKARNKRRPSTTSRAKRKTLERLQRKKRKAALIQLHQNAQRLLEPVEVVNPHARTHSFSGKRTRSRRDHMKLLSLIRSIAFLHQHQRAHKEDIDGTIYIEATLDDVNAASTLLTELLDHALDDLPPQTRSLYEKIETYVAEHASEEDDAPVAFCRRQLREYTGLGDTQLKVHLRRLVDMELLTTRRQSYHGGLWYRLAALTTSIQAIEEDADSIGRGRAQKIVERYSQVANRSGLKAIGRASVGASPDQLKCRRRKRK